MAVKNLELKQRKIELMKVSSARAELDLRIEQMMEEVNRVKAAVAIQENRENELHKIIEELQSKAE